MQWTSVFSYIRTYTVYVYTVLGIASASRSIIGEQTHAGTLLWLIPKDLKSRGDAYRQTMAAWHLRVVSPVLAELRHYDEYDCCIQSGSSATAKVQLENCR